MLVANEQDDGPGRRVRRAQAKGEKEWQNQQKDFTGSAHLALNLVLVVVMASAARVVGIFTYIVRDA
jgi:hypothetical protein